jgi:hypothetical protein
MQSKMQAFESEDFNSDTEKMSKVLNSILTETAKKTQHAKRVLPCTIIAHSNIQVFDATVE